MDARGTHPAGIPPSALWFGREVEGFLTNLFTAFVAHRLTDPETDLLKEHEEVKQLFLTETFGKPEDFAWLDTLMPWIAGKGLALTKGVMSHEAESWIRYRDAVYCGSSCSRRMTLIVRYFDAPWVGLLSDDDQVSVGVPYHMITCQVSSCVLTEPGEYKRDHL